MTPFALLAVSILGSAPLLHYAQEIRYIPGLPEKYLLRCRTTSMCNGVKSPQIHKFQNSPPVVDKKHGVFYMIWAGKCISFMVKTGAQGPTVALG